uniref:RNF34/RFFL HeH domain-containing protein n=1 Tax=Pyrodinium bahamense TaxID=73915 RepID=A0A7S0AAU1_9DINO|mmetsp:Transcript_29835/g.82185  ORF Transcript_29835/g.82185 Transcript_29835/m.82185 type:complete len:246 (+) Transcript_29835:1-738(+)
MAAASHSPLHSAPPAGLVAGVVLPAPQLLESRTEELPRLTQVPLPVGQRPRPGWLPMGARCGVCSKKVADECGGVVCQRRGGDGTAGCGEGVCWRCMKRAPRDSFGGVRTTREEFESWGDDAWWMHEGCMRDEDWADYVGEGAAELAQEAAPEPAEGGGEAAAGKVTVATEDERLTPPELDEVPRAEEQGQAGPGVRVETLSVRQLKDILAANHVDCADCIEKADLVKRVLKTLNEGQAREREVD